MNDRYQLQRSIAYEMAVMLFAADCSADHHLCQVRQANTPDNTVFQGMGMTTPPCKHTPQRYTDPFTTCWHPALLTSALETLALLPSLTCTMSSMMVKGWAIELYQRQLVRILAPFTTSSPARFFQGGILSFL